MAALLVLFHMIFVVTTIHYSFGPPWVYEYYQYVWTSGMVVINLEILWYVLKGRWKL